MHNNYSDTQLVGYTQPLLVNVIPCIKYQAQNMVEPTFRQELQCIREVNHLWYIIAMIVWFCQWRQEQGWCPPLAACSFQVGALATAIIKTRVVSVTLVIKMTPGGETSLVGTDYSPVPGQSGPKKSTSGTCCPQHVVHYVTPAAGRDLVYTSCCTGICHFN